MLCFFHLAGAVQDADDEGFDVATIGEARILAATHIGEILRDRPELVWSGDEIRLEVTDEHQIVLFTVITVGVDAAVSEGEEPSFRPPRELE